VFLFLLLLGELLELGTNFVLFGPWAHLGIWQHLVCNFVVFVFGASWKVDQLRDQRVQGGAGMGWMWSGGGNLAPGPLGSVAGDPDRHRGWLICPSSVPAAAGRGLRPRVLPAHS
jgi:hypothetical protein